MDSNNCFICAKELMAGEKSLSSSLYPNARINILLCNILEISIHSPLCEKLTCCSECTERVFYIQDIDMIQELERLEEKVLHEKHVIENQLKQSVQAQTQQCFDNQGNSIGISTQQIRSEIVIELEAAAISTILAKIRTKRVGKRRMSAKILKNVTINNLKIPPSSDGSNRNNPNENETIATASSSQGEIQIDTPNYPNLEFVHFDLKDDIDINDEVVILDPLGGLDTDTSASAHNASTSVLDTDMDTDHGHGQPNVLPVCPNFAQTEAEAETINISTLLSSHSSVPYKTKKRKKRLNLNLSEKLKRNHPICDECGKYFIDNTALGRHVQASGHRHQFTLFKFKCKFCNFGIDHLDSHRCHLSDPKKCKKCPKVFNSAELLRSHVTQKHPDKFADIVPPEIIESSTESEFKCSICSKYFKCMNSLQIHKVSCIIESILRGDNIG